MSIKEDGFKASEVFAVSRKLVPRLRDSAAAPSLEPGFTRKLPSDLDVS